VYANYIEGLSKGQTAPATAANAGELFAPYKTKQKEIGLKIDLGEFTHTFSLFEIQRPSSYTDPVTNVFSFGGEQRNRGVEWGFFGSPWSGVRLMGGVAYVDPEVTRAAVAASQGKQATGVPKLQGKLGVEWDVPGVQGLTLTGNATAVSKQYISADNSLSVAGRTTYDVGARYATRLASRPVTLRASVSNLTNKAYWGMPLLSSLALGAPRTSPLSAPLDFCGFRPGGAGGVWGGRPPHPHGPRSGGLGRLPGFGRSPLRRTVAGRQLLRLGGAAGLDGRHGLQGRQQLLLVQAGQELEARAQQFALLDHVALLRRPQLQPLDGSVLVLGDGEAVAHQFRLFGFGIPACGRRSGGGCGRGDLSGGCGRGDLSGGWRCSLGGGSRLCNRAGRLGDFAHGHGDDFPYKQYILFIPFFQALRGMRIDSGSGRTGTGTWAIRWQAGFPKIAQTRHKRLLPRR
jgi:hypothetical protein